MFEVIKFFFFSIYLLFSTPSLAMITWIIVSNAIMANVFPTLDVSLMKQKQTKSTHFYWLYG